MYLDLICYGEQIKLISTRFLRILVEEFTFKTVSSYRFILFINCVNCIAAIAFGSLPKIVGLSCYGY